MKLLEEKILAEGRAINEDILKVDSFVNHQVEPLLMKEIGEHFAGHFKDRHITKGGYHRKLRHCPGADDCPRPWCSYDYSEKRAL